MAITPQRYRQLVRVMLHRHAPATVRRLLASLLRVHSRNDAFNVVPLCRLVTAAASSVPAADFGTASVSPAKAALKLADEPGVDGGIFAVQQMIQTLQSRAIVLDDVVAAAFVRALHATAQSKNAEFALDALFKFETVIASISIPPTSIALRSVWSAFVEAGLRRPDSVLLLRAVSAVVKNRGQITPHALFNAVDVFRIAQQIESQRDNRFDVAVDERGVARLLFPVAVTPQPVSAAQWDAILNTLFAHCAEPACATDSHYYLSALADMGKVKPAFLEFDRLEEVRQPGWPASNRM